MTFRRFETFIIIAVIGFIGVIYALTQKPTPVVTHSSQTQEQPVEQAKVQEVPTTAVSYQGEAGKNAMEILKERHQVKTQNFSGVGEFVTSIDGVEADSKTNFWSFYVNGRQSPVGASQYETKPGDMIEWKLETVAN
jgi:hypothetical protein